MKAMIFAVPAMALLAAAASAQPAGAPAVTAATADRVNRVIVYGNDPCPRGTGRDIVICGRRGAGERYRIPQELRDDATADDPESTSWAAQATSLEYVGRTGIQSCSTVGPGGFTGCWAELMRAARNEQRTSDGEPGR
jgi:hypothetical protein